MPGSKDIADFNDLENTPLLNPLTNLDSPPLTFIDVFKKISGIAIPMAGSFTFSFAVFLILILLSRLNKDEDHVAAASLTTLMMNTLVGASASLFFSMSIIASHKVGELQELERLKEDDRENEDYDPETSNEELIKHKKVEIAVINRNGLAIAVVVAPLLMTPMIFSKSILTNIFGQDEKVAEIVQDATELYSIAGPALMLRICSEQMMFSLKQSGPAAGIGIVNFGIGTGLAIWLGFGGLGVPRYGIPGVIGGYIIEAYLTALAYALFIAWHKNFRDFYFFNLFAKFENNTNQILELLKIGLPISFSVLTEIATSLVCGILAGLVGSTEQATLTYIMQFVFFALIVSIAFGQSCCQEMSREIGARNYENASKIGKYGLVTTASYLLPPAIALTVYPKLLMQILDHDDSKILALLEDAGPLFFLGTVVEALRYGVLQQLRSLGDHQGATLVSITGLFAGMVTGSILALKTDLGIYGVGIAYAGGPILALLGLLYRWGQFISPERIQELSENPTMVNYLNLLFNSCANGYARLKNSNSEMAQERPRELRSFVHLSYGSASSQTG